MRPAGGHAQVQRLADRPQIFHGLVQRQLRRFGDEVLGGLAFTSSKTK